MGMKLWKTEAGELCPSAEKYAEKLQGKFQLSAEGKKVKTPLPPTELEGLKAVEAMNEF